MPWNSAPSKRVVGPSSAYSTPQYNANSEVEPISKPPCALSSDQELATNRGYALMFALTIYIIRHSLRFLYY